MTNWSAGSNDKLGMGPELPSSALSGRLLGRDWRGIRLGLLGARARAARPGNAMIVHAWSVMRIVSNTARIMMVVAKNCKSKVDVLYLSRSVMLRSLAFIYLKQLRKR